MFHAINIDTISESEAHKAIRDACKDNPSRANSSVGQYRVLFDKFGDKGHIARLQNADKQVVALAIVDANDTPPSETPAPAKP